MKRTTACTRFTIFSVIAACLGGVFPSMVFSQADRPETADSGSSLASHYGGGTGDANDPFQIWTAEDFVSISHHAEDWGSHFRLMADVDLVDVNASLIAPIGNLDIPFHGVFDGNDHTIQNFHFASETVQDVGVFGVISRLELMDRIDPTRLGIHYILQYDDEAERYPLAP